MKIVDTKDPDKTRRRKVPWLMGVVLLALLTILVLLQSSNLWKDVTVDTASGTLLLYALSSLNFIAFVVFGFIFLRSLTKLMRERRTFQLGAKIKSRLLLYFVAISILPIVAMAGFSYLFMNRALERWFAQFPETVVLEAREVERRSIAEQQDRFMETAKVLGAALDRSPNIDDSLLSSIVGAGNFRYVEVRGSDGLVASAGSGLTSDERARLAETEASLSPGVNVDDELEIAVVEMSGARRLIAVPNQRPASGLIQMADRSLLEFDRLKERQATVRQIGLLTLGVLTFLLIFASTWVAFYIARGLTGPIKALAEGANEIARGNLDHRVDVLAEDELALLVEAFNEMSSRLSSSSAELVERRRYIETVLQSLPTGVISIGSDDRVQTINRAAIEMLRPKSVGFSGVQLTEIIPAESYSVFHRLIARARRTGRSAEQTTFRSEEQLEITAALTATSLAASGGVVIVIEDLSELMAAQRASAWREVARRMAHEIKNPLTPIQLAAERIAKRFHESRTVAPVAAAPAISGVAADERVTSAIEEGTATIIREVQGLKAMVDEFSRYARLPEAKLERGDVNNVIEQAVALYEGRAGAVEIRKDLSSELPSAMIDPEQLKRAFVNLIDNAMEAFEDTQKERLVAVSSTYDRARDLIICEIADNGSGIAPGNLKKLFQPYFSTKGRETGLGLAIVQRIMTEHKGRIHAAAGDPQGARFILEFPAASDN